jgi:hypothetical protein
MRRIVTCLALAALSTGCVGAAPATPIIVYVTPVPSEDPTSGPATSTAPFEILASPPPGRNLPVGTSTPEPTPRPPGHFDSITGQWIPDVIVTPGPTPTPAPTPTPTPTPAPPVTKAELEAVCAGTPISRAAKYAGTVHPLVVVDEGSLEGEGEPWNFEINAKWYGDAWPGPIQLVVCVDTAKPVKLGSCGSYTRESDGASGQIIRYRYTQKVRVVIARTGKQLQYRSLTGTTPQCEAHLSLPASGPPPWGMYGDDVSDSAINKYATAVARQKVK